MGSLHLYLIALAVFKEVLPGILREILEAEDLLTVDSGHFITRKPCMSMTTDIVLLTNSLMPLVYLPMAEDGLTDRRRP
jgi:hypothetical protein